MSAIVPFRARATMPGNCAPWLRAGTGERWQYAEGAMIDARMEKVAEGTLAHIPLVRYPYDRTQILSVPADDALAQIGGDRLIVRGLTEASASYGERLRKAFTTWRYAGTSRAVLSQILGYLLSVKPMVRMVWTSYETDPARLTALLDYELGPHIVAATATAPIVITTNVPHNFATGSSVTISNVQGLVGANGAFTVTALSPTTFSPNGTTGSGTYTAGTGHAALTSDIPTTSYPATRNSSTWDTYAAGRDLNVEPTRVYVQAGGAGDWDWDSASPVTGSYGFWGAWVIIYNVDATGAAWTTTAPLWGAGQTYTPSGDGYYSTVSGSAYVASGSYAGAGTLWGTGSTYSPSSDGYYSSVSSGAYQPSGSYTGSTRAWGLSVTAAVGQSVVGIMRLFKGAPTWIRGLIISFSAALFDPTQTADDVHNPNGTWGYWSLISGGAYAPSRLSNAVYSDDPLHELG